MLKVDFIDSVIPVLRKNYPSLSWTIMRSSKLLEGGMTLNTGLFSTMRIIIHLFPDMDDCPDVDEYCILFYGDKRIVFTYFFDVKGDSFDPIEVVNNIKKCGNTLGRISSVAINGG